MNYSNIIAEFTWSYSRIKQFEMCPHAFYLNYLRHASKKPMFFSGYGSLIHKLIEQRLIGELPREELPIEYLKRFRREVRGKAPNQKIFQTYFDQGLLYLDNFNFPYKPLCVELKTEFSVNEKPFVGIIDCLAQDGEDIIVVDNKSRALKPRSDKKKPTKSDAELDEYLRQLYLYSIPVIEKFGKAPARLEFNCFRTGQWISEPFRPEALEEAKQWASDGIKNIEENEDWTPNPDYWVCHHLCDFCDSCQYKTLFF